MVGKSFKAHGEASSSENRAHRPGGDGGSSPGGGRSLLQGSRGAIFFREPSAPAWGGRGVQPRGWSENPSRPMGRRLLRRTGHTGLGGTGGPAQGVVGLSEGRREGRLDRVPGLFQGWRGRGWEGGHPAPHCAVLCCVVLRRVVGCAAMCCVLCCASAERAQVKYTIKRTIKDAIMHALEHTIKRTIKHTVDPAMCGMPCLVRDALPRAGCPTWCGMPCLVQDAHLSSLRPSSPTTGP